MTTMFIITIIKSSLVLSLGLIGALSIIRFRTAIKEPEELTYLFLAIAIGLGLGANQRTIILIAFLLTHLIIWTLIPSISNINLPLDTIESLAWGSSLEWGSNKHPPAGAFFIEIF